MHFFPVRLLRQVHRPADTEAFQRGPGPQLSLLGEAHGARVLCQNTFLQDKSLLCRRKLN